jgi:hypothetical protein
VSESDFFEDRPTAHAASPADINGDRRLDLFALILRPVHAAIRPGPEKNILELKGAWIGIIMTPVSFSELRKPANFCLPMTLPFSGRSG